MSLSLRDENEWEILCSSSTTWLMINLFTSIVIYDVRRIGFTDNEERKENAHAPIFGWMCSGLERTAKKSLYLFILVINVRITVISAFGTSSQMRIDTIFAVDIYIYIQSMQRHVLANPRDERCKCAKRKIIRHEVVACGCVLLFRSPIIALKWMEEWCRVEIITVCYGLWSGRRDR